jgi:hypothetical protein
MPTFIKPGFWALEKIGYKGWLNLNKFVQDNVSTPTLQQVATTGNTSNKSILVDVNGAVAINAIEARSDVGYGIYAESYGEDGVHSLSYVKDALHGTSELGNGVVGQSAEGYGVYAYSTNNDGVNATSINKTAVYAQSTNENAIAAYSTAGYGLYAQSVNEDGVNTKSVTRHGLNTFSDSGDGVYSSTNSGHAIYAESTILGGVGKPVIYARSLGGTNTVIKAESAAFSTAVEAISNSGTGISALSQFGSAGIFETVSGSVAMSITSGSISYYNTTIYHNSVNGAGLYVGSSSNGITAYGSSSPGYYGIITNTAAKDGGGVWDAYSDSRVKENVNPYTKGLAEILLINPVSYDYNGLGGIKQSTGHVGVIAQEINTVLPETVGTYSAKLNEDDEENTDLLTFNGTALTYVLINAIKELKIEIDSLKNEIELLKA